MNRDDIALQFFIKRVPSGYVTQQQESNIKATATECYLIADLFLEVKEKVNAQEPVAIAFSDESDV